MSPNTVAFINAWAPYLGPPLAGLLFAAAAWVLSKVPGPIRDALLAVVRGRDNASLINAANSGAAELVLKPGETPSIPKVVDYIRASIPGVLDRQQPAQRVLEAVASKAIIAQTAIAAAPAAVAEPGIAGGQVG